MERPKPSFPALDRASLFREPAGTTRGRAWTRRRGGWSRPDNVVIGVRRRRAQRLVFGFVRHRCEPQRRASSLFTQTLVVLGHVLIGKLDVGVLRRLVAPVVIEFVRQSLLLRARGEQRPCPLGRLLEPRQPLGKCGWRRRDDMKHSTMLESNRETKGTERAHLDVQHDTGPQDVTRWRRTSHPRHPVPCAASSWVLLPRASSFSPDVSTVVHDALQNAAYHASVSAFVSPYTWTAFPSCNATLT
ncbi:hypothetical protein PsorP6_001653 [Peronosclerospora sorghi]|uniref:Uncharacterized protein n=1 Tax=Peronosclerospora sorghi TaxID=230839 RepID=A0ACC0WW11_9STRA|nr:hypothetical protein PsorP6_001653 [Peronosclerospora sorghi]